MSEVLQVLAQLIIENFFFIYSVFINFILFFILIVIAMKLGPLLGDIFRMSLGMIRRPAGVLRFTNAQIVSLRIREYAPVIKVDEKDPTSELVHMNKDHGFQMSTENPEKKPGFFAKLRGEKQSPEARLNEVYTDEFIPVNVNKKANFYLWGIPIFVIVEGVNSTINPMVSFTQREQVRAASIAVEQSLLANKLIAEDRFRNEIATKSDVRNWSLLQLFVVGIGMVFILLLLFSLQSSFDAFIKFVDAQWATFKPVIDQILSETPRIIYNDTGGA